MGIFGKKKTDGTETTTGTMTGTTGTTTTTQTTRGTTGWQVDCTTECGFMVRDHNKEELVQIVKTHVKTSHGQTVTDADALKKARTVTF